MPKITIDNLKNDIKNLTMQRNKCYGEAKRFQYILSKKKKLLKNIERGVELNG